MGEREDRVKQSVIKSTKEERKLGCNDGFQLSEDENTQPIESQVSRKNVAADDAPILQNSIQRRFSVIRLVKDAEEEKEESEAEAEVSSPGSSLIVDESDGSVDAGFKETDENVNQLECLPVANPSEVECVVTDTSDDEISDPEKREVPKQCITSKLRGSKKKNDLGPQLPQITCDVCESVFNVQDCPNELLKHMQTVHKFAVRVLVKDSSLCHKQNETSSKDGVTQRKLSDELDQASSQSSNVNGQEGDHRGLMFSCHFCSVKIVSRQLMLRHLQQKHNCVRGSSEPALTALALSCRVCKNQFWSVDERSNHEVKQHPEEAAHLILKCCFCCNSFSSKVCLKKHVHSEHPEQETHSGPIAFRCRLCFSTFPKIPNINEHFRQKHPSMVVYQCGRCNLTLKTKKSYLFHIKSLQCSEIKRECTLCNKVMWSKRAVSIHYRMKHSNANRVGFLCRICKKRFDTKAERKQHYMIDHEGVTPFQCPICNKGFASKSGMYGHKQTHAKSGVSKCEFCGKEFIRRDSYNEHLLIHSGRRHKCPHCTKEFVQRSNLVRHIRIHTGEKPYKCSFCDKTFSDKGACNSHIRVHTREEACGCPYCGQVFSKKQKLKYHIRKHTGEGLVSCEFCNKSFTNSHSLKEHRLIHDRRTQILCSHCGKAFTTAKYLQRHIAMIHEATYVYNCPLCSRGFSQHGRLKTHLLTHSGIKHLRCLLCTKAYSSRKSLRRHLLNMHGMPAEHPDYKSCFYAMSPQEAGLSMSGIQATSVSPGNLSLLEPKSEPLSAESDDSDIDDSFSDEDFSLQTGSHRLQRHESFNPFIGMKTKAARKQLPFAEIFHEKKTRGRPKTDKSSQSKTNQAENRTRGSRQAAPKANFYQSRDSDDDSDSSLSSNGSKSKSSRFPRKGRSRLSTKCKSKKKSVSNKGVDQTEGPSSGSSQTRKNISVGSSSNRISKTDPTKFSRTVPESNRRARYKLQTPKKRVLNVDSDSEDAQ